MNLRLLHYRFQRLVLFVRRQRRREALLTCIAATFLLAVYFTTLVSKQANSNIVYSEASSPLLLEQRLRHPGSSHGSGLVDNSRNRASTLMLASVANLGVHSKKGERYESIIVTGQLHADDLKHFTIDWKNQQRMSVSRNHGGRGLELAEAVEFGGRYLALDGATGVIYEILRSSETGKFFLAPRHIVNAKQGDESSRIKRMAWATAKEGVLYVGSAADELIPGPEAETFDEDRWVARISLTGQVEYQDWTNMYARLKKAAGIAPEHKLLHRAVLWSSYLRLWIFVPQRVPAPMPAEDTLLLLANDDFSSVEAKMLPIAKNDSDDGFSALRFVPGSADKTVIALKTSRKPADQSTSVYVFNLDDGDMQGSPATLNGARYEGLFFMP